MFLSLFEKQFTNLKLANRERDRWDQGGCEGLLSSCRNLTRSFPLSSAYQAASLFRSVGQDTFLGDARAFTLQPSGDTT